MAQTRPEPCPNPPSPLFHGTTALLKPGDVVLPGAEVGRGRGQWVWMDTRSDTSWGGVCRHVYEVQPLDEVQTARGWWRTKRAVVVRSMTGEQ